MKKLDTMLFEGRRVKIKKIHSDDNRGIIPRKKLVGRIVEFISVTVAHVDGHIGCKVRLREDIHFDWNGEKRVQKSGTEIDLYKAKLSPAYLS